MKPKIKNTQVKNSKGKLLMIIRDESTLRKISKKTSPKECKKKEIFERLLLALSQSDTSGMGLSAIQIGEDLRAGIISYSDGSKLKMINPEIIEKSNSIMFRGEGCLSFPGKYINTSRYNTVTAKWIDQKGKKHKAEFVGMEAVVLQHEIDHMDGIIFLDRQFQPYKRKSPKIGRNAPCPLCQEEGKFIKYKKCQKHFEKDI